MHCAVELVQCRLHLNVLYVFFPLNSNKVPRPPRHVLLSVPLRGVALKLENLPVNYPSRLCFLYRYYPFLPVMLINAHHSLPSSVSISALFFFSLSINIWYSETEGTFFHSGIYFILQIPRKSKDPFPFWNWWAYFLVTPTQNQNQIHLINCVTTIFCCIYQARPHFLLEFIIWYPAKLWGNTIFSEDF